MVSKAISASSKFGDCCMFYRAYIVTFERSKVTKPFVEQTVLPCTVAQQAASMPPPR
jgi:hypothetical protein